MATDRLPLVVGAGNITAECEASDSIKSPNDLVAGSRNTGGKDIYGRHYFINVLGAEYLLDVDGSVYSVGRFMADGSPATQLQYYTGPVGAPLSKQAFAIDVATGQFNVPQLEHASRITFSDGKVGATALAVGQKVRSLVSGNWIITGWTLISDAAGALRIEVRKITYASYTGTVPTSMSGTSTSTGGIPRIGLVAIKGTSTNVSIWPDTTVSDGDIIEVEVNTTGGLAGWYSLALIGTQVHI